MRAHEGRRVSRQLLARITAPRHAHTQAESSAPHAPCVAATHRQLPANGFVGGAHGVTAEAWGGAWCHARAVAERKSTGACCGARGAGAERVAGGRAGLHLLPRPYPRHGVVWARSRQLCPIKGARRDCARRRGWTHPQYRLGFGLSGPSRLAGGRAWCHPNARGCRRRKLRRGDQGQIDQKKGNVVDYDQLKNQAESPRLFVPDLEIRGMTYLHSSPKIAGLYLYIAHTPRGMTEAPIFLFF
jgi:hypothetical protein